MSTFLTYNTDDPQAPTGTYPALGSSNTPLVLGTLATGIAAKVAGSIFSDSNGTLLVQQTFENIAEFTGATGGDSGTAYVPHWDISQSFSITGGTPQTIDIDVVAPWLQVVFTNSGTNAHLRIFIRVFGNRVGT